MGKNTVKTKKYNPRNFESDPSLIGRNYDTSANVYHSMLLSPAWKDLTSKQRDLYYVCKDQMYAQKHRPKEDEENGISKTAFYMNRYIWGEQYELYSLGSNEAAFYRDMAALIEHGFIRCVASGRSRKTKSIYDYSDRWRFFGTDSFSIPDRDKTPTMVKKATEKKGKP